MLGQTLAPLRLTQAEVKSALMECLRAHMACIRLGNDAEIMMAIRVAEQSRDLPGGTVTEIEQALEVGSEIEAERAEKIEAANDPTKPKSYFPKKFKPGGRR